MIRLVGVIATLLVAAVTAAQEVPPPDAATARSLADASIVERQTLQRLLASDSWPRRAIAAMRLERFDDDESRAALEALLRDPAWQVRAFAVTSLGRRRVPAGETWFADEDEPRVLRAALRHRYTIDPERLARGVNYLARQQNLERKMLAVEIGAASGDAALRELAAETARTIILRMDQAEAGILSARLAAVTDAGDLHRHYRWRSWLMKTGRGFAVHPAWALPDDPAARPPLSLMARLDDETFADLEDYIQKLRQRRVDLAICLDTTASMSGELADAQAGMDDLMRFAGDVVAEFRVAVIAYRDRRDRYETQGWEFTVDIGEARRRLWQLDAEGGGDSPEAVYPALRQAYTKLGWIPAHTKVLVLVGDAPPHVGFGTQCIEMATAAKAQSDLVTHTIQAAGKPVKHFAEIAEAGGGECVELTDGDSLTARITGLTLGERYEEEFREFFRAYLALCR